MTAESVTIDYSFIKKFLRSGDIKKLAKENHLKPDAAYKRLAGTVKDPEFIKKACDLAIIRANEFIKMKETMNQLTEKIAAL